MTSLHDFLPEPRVHEDDWVHVSSTAMFAFEVARHHDLARSPLVAALFWLRMLPERLGKGRLSTPPPDLHLDAIGRGPRGFRVLHDGPNQLIVGAIGRFWESEITFADVAKEDFATFAEPGWGKVVWSLRTEAVPGGSRLGFELALTATDDAAWKQVHRYYGLIGPFSRFIRRHELGLIARDLGGKLDLDAQRSLPGDELIARPKAEATNVVIIDAPPEAVWPWLVQMGRGRGGWYSHDALDNDGEPSATEIVPALQSVRVGDVLPASADRRYGFTIQVLDPPRAFVLGALYDTAHESELPMTGDRPEQFWQSTWAFTLEAIEGRRTRLWVRVRVDYGPESLPARLQLHALALAHRFMEGEQLKNLKERAEGRAGTPHTIRLPDVLEASFGAVVIATNLATPFLRDVRSHWGLTREEAAKAQPGDALIEAPRWQWTHAVEIAAPPDEVWPWVAQLGQDKGGFYSYVVLENLVGCQIHNAERLHAEWGQPHVGDAFLIHPNAPALTFHEVVAPQRFVLKAGMDRDTGRAPRVDCGRPYVAVTWAFILEPTEADGTRLISRYRCACSSDLATRLAYGPYIAESVGFAMDRRMLLGIQERAERAHGARVPAPTAPAQHSSDSGALPR